MPSESADANGLEVGAAMGDPAYLKTLTPKPGLIRRVRDGIGSASEWLFGGFALVIGLAILSATPILQLLSFGYLLESGGRVARTGRLRDALIGVRRAARLGSMVIGCSLMLLPLQVIASWTAAAELVDPGGPIARRWRVGLLILAALMVLHMLTACARGGKLRYFFWPFTTPLWLVRRVRRGGIYASARDEVWDFVTALHFPYYFRLGLLGLVGTMAWLLVPVSLIALGRRFPLIGILGGLLLAIVSLALPFLQMRFAAENRFAALFEYREVRERFRRAPWAFAVAAFLTLTFAIPLYLLKIEMIPRETAWLPSLVFLGFIFPARTLTGWAYARSGRREQVRHWFFRWTSRLAMFATGLAYALIVFFTQYTAWQGIWSLYEQHAFMLPVPFLNM
ncbi:hypothetical protein [Singulisphaera sp. GP187]|uniref:hypothetical protein n=1 Tax=Singulisphaera sp. GP187 TaxID=1882752 RepID=UPI0020B11BE4|nr:hypothetical protein [Singulisphaera sp. GP187]